MIKGKFINENVPVVKVTIFSDQAVQTPYFILDTGFTGDLQVTAEIAKELGLEVVSVTRTGMASGEIITLYGWGLKLRSKREFETTETEDSAMAKPASSGLNVRPAKAKRPAAIGMPIIL